MNRIQSCFEGISRSGRTALIPYITAGDPHPDLTVALMHTLVEAGADIIELGVPFSDPMADGPVIQAACERALAQHTSLYQVLGMVGDFRKRNQHTPIVLMGYQNPIEVMGTTQFAFAASQNQVDAVLTVDLPIEQAQSALTVYRQHAIDSIFLIAPTTRPARIKSICDQSSGFVYYVSLKGVTGAGHLDISEVKSKVAEIKKVSMLPVGVGFGIKDAESARSIASVADAVVVGSALIRRIEANLSDPKAMQQSIKSMLTSMRTAMDNAPINKEVA